MPTTRLEFFDTIPDMRGVITATGVAAPFITPERLGRPHTMMLVVTRRCNSRCKMCNIWQEKKSPMLSVEQYQHMFRNPLPSFRALVLTGGEATLRKDLPEIWAIARNAMPRLEYGMLATSGLNPQRALSQVEAICRNIEANPGKITVFDVQVSLDGIEDMHDQVRGIDGFFEKVKRTLDGLEKLAERYPFLKRHLSTVVMPENIAHIPGIKAFAAERGLPVNFSPVVVSGHYYRNEQDAEMLGFVANSERSKIAQESFRQLSEEDQTSMSYYYDDVVQMLGGGTRKRTCLMGFFGCVVEHMGDVYPCINWENERFGNLMEQPFDDIWFGEQAQQARYNLRATGCPSCPSMCYPHASGPKEVLGEKLGYVRQRAANVIERIRS